MSLKELEKGKSQYEIVWANGDTVPRVSNFGSRQKKVVGFILRSFNSPAANK